MASYLQKLALFPAQITDPAAKDLNIIVVIPCYDEPDLIKSLEALLQADPPVCSVEVIIVINDSDQDDERIKAMNKDTYLVTEKWSTIHNSSKLKFYTLYHSGLPEKKAGVGLARKIGMDEAVYRYESIKNSKGIILCFDADSLCKKNYFQAVENHFEAYPETEACSIYFEHPIEGSSFPYEVYESIILYELHLRYYINAKRFAGFPYAYQTIGSSMAVRCDAYQKQGGMNKRRAGEDFYFLNKFMPSGNFSEIKTTTVIPSPRISHRVPFGTGKAISEMIESKLDMTTYAPQTFIDLKSFFKQVPDLFTLKSEEIQPLFSALTESISSFLKKQEFESKLLEIQANTTNAKTFNNRFFRWFNAFLLMKYVHYSRDHYYPNVPVETAARWLLENHFMQMDIEGLEAKAMLLRIRMEDRK